MILLYSTLIYKFPLVMSAVVSLSPQTYTVEEAEEVVNVIVTKTGNFQRPIQGVLSTSVGSAGGKLYDQP